jgi:predicted RNA-binding Zn ribbon-like protein
MPSLTVNPDPLAALDLVNSLTPEGIDLLEDGGWRGAAFERWGVAVRQRPTRRDLDALRDLRGLLRRVVERLASGAELTEADLHALNRAIAGPIRARLEHAPDGGYQVDMRALASSWREFAVRELAGSFVALLRRSHPPRIKVCANPDCRRAFYDETKSGTRRWCDSATCGNRMRVRRHRARGGV